MQTYINKTTRLSRLQKIQAGIGKHLSNVSSITLGGVSYAPADLEKLIQADLDTMKASAKAHADWLAQVSVERNSHTKVGPVLRLLKAYVISLFGETQDASGKLEDFGYSPRKPSLKTLAVKVEARDQAKATREARHTMGKQQKKAVKGQKPATPPAKPQA
jgi:hypothetical protein